jgi:hypothetical protein
MTGMNAPVTAMAIRMRPLPRRHRIAHLRALIGQQAAGSVRRDELPSPLRDECIAGPESGIRTVCGL